MFNIENIKTSDQLSAEKLNLDKSIERAWRNSELINADIGLNKVQDGRGAGSVTNWRDYRNELRDWPQHESFPDPEFRPKAPA